MIEQSAFRPDFTDGVGEGIGMIWAEAQGGAIGRAGTMPWQLPEDLAHFKSTTMGAPVIMGRRTWESLPDRVRPLPGRQNVVVTRDAGYEAPGATVVTSLEAALEASSHTVKNEQAAHLQTLVSDEAGVCSDPGVWPSRAAWVMGGGELYRLAMPLADELVVTRIEVEVPDADTFAPKIGEDWRLAHASEPATSSTGLTYRIERYVRA